MICSTAHNIIRLRTGTYAGELMMMPLIDYRVSETAHQTARPLHTYPGAAIRRRT
jgi:hypothetical protein